MSDDERPAPTAADSYEALTALPGGFRKAKRAKLIEFIERMAQDFQTLNAIHNATAVNRGWCEEYEQRQRAHNERLSVLKLVGRESGLQGGYEGGRML